MGHKHSVTDDTTKVVGIAAIAAAIGAVVAMLVTPRSGNQVRKGLKRRADHLNERLHDHSDDRDIELSDPIADGKENLQVKAEKAATKARAKAADIKTEVKSVKRRVTEAADKAEESSK